LPLLHHLLLTLLQGLLLDLLGALLLHLLLVLLLDLLGALLLHLLLMLLLDLLGALLLHLLFVLLLDLLGALLLHLLLVLLLDLLGALLLHLLLVLLLSLPRRRRPWASLARWNLTRQQLSRRRMFGSGRSGARNGSRGLRMTLSLKWRDLTRERLREVLARRGLPGSRPYGLLPRLERPRACRAGLNWQ
jgi:hypothetical protein